MATVSTHQSHTRRQQPYPLRQDDAASSTSSNTSVSSRSSLLPSIINSSSTSCTSTTIMVQSNSVSEAKGRNLYSARARASSRALSPNDSPHQPCARQQQRRQQQQNPLTQRRRISDRLSLTKEIERLTLLQTNTTSPAKEAFIARMLKPHALPSPPRPPTPRAQLLPKVKRSESLGSAADVAKYADDLFQSKANVLDPITQAPQSTTAAAAALASSAAAKPKRNVAELQLAYRKMVSLGEAKTAINPTAVTELIQQGLPLNKALDLAPPLEPGFQTDDELERVAHPLSYAVRRGVEPELIAALVEGGAAVNANYDYIQRKADGTTATVSTTPLCLAAQLHFGNTERTIGVIRVLLAGGGLIGTTDSSGCSALYYAVAWGSAATVQVLLQHAAASSPSWLTRMLNATQTITHAAEADARAQILLLDVAEAESDSEGTRMTTVTDMMPEQAAKAQLLLDYGADGELKVDASGWSPLYAAAYQGKGTIVKAMLAAGCNQHRVTLDSGWTAVFAAASAGSLEAVRALVDAGGSTASVDLKGRTPAHDACANGHYDVVKYLLEHGCSADTVADKKPAEHWSTPALMACSTADLEPNFDGVTSRKLGDLLELLCVHGADIHQQVPETGATCLHYTASQGNLDATKRLVAFGADILGPKHKSNATALDLAIDYGREEVAAFLTVAAPWVKNAAGKRWRLDKHLINLDVHGNKSTAPARKREDSSGTALHAAAAAAADHQLHTPVYVKSSALLEVAALVGCAAAVRWHLANGTSDPHLLAVEQDPSNQLGKNMAKRFVLPAELLNGYVGDGAMHSFPEEAKQKAREALLNDAGYRTSMALLQRAAQPWSWHTHSLFHSGVKRVVGTVLMVSHRHWHCDAPPLGLPHVPIEIWHYVLSFVRRSEHAAEEDVEEDEDQPGCISDVDSDSDSDSEYSSDSYDSDDEV